MDIWMRQDGIGCDGRRRLLNARPKPVAYETYVRYDPGIADNAMK